MNEATKYTICRACEQTSIIDELFTKAPKKTETARKIIMTRLLREEQSLKYLVRHG
jgi:hypothetical protein